MIAPVLDRFESHHIGEGLAQRASDRVLDIFFASREPLLEDAAGCEMSLHDIVEFLGIEQA